MSSIFSGLTGIRFPEVVRNTGPLPPSGGLPAPLHDTPDARINYNSTLLGDIRPYAYGEPGYLSSQNSYLCIPHRVQKFIPLIYLPEPKGDKVFKLSHSVDDGDIAMVMRIIRHSIFCTGGKDTPKRQGYSTTVDPLLNLPTLNYILAGIQVNCVGEYNARNLWWELLHNLDCLRWIKGDKKDYETEPLDLSDLIHVVKHCIRPFGVVRGSEKQGGQTEMTNSPATWPVPAICTLVIDGKDGNVTNIWHNNPVSCGDDLVFRMKLMPLPNYTLNHYYKGYAQKSFPDEDRAGTMVWQMVPDVMNFSYDHQNNKAVLDHFEKLNTDKDQKKKSRKNFLFEGSDPADVNPSWQDMGYWHIGRTQMSMVKNVATDYHCNDMVNNLGTPHIQITFEPVFQCWKNDGLGDKPRPLGSPKQSQQYVKEFKNATVSVSKKTTDLVSKLAKKVQPSYSWHESSEQGGSFADEIGSLLSSSKKAKVAPSLSFADEIGSLLSSPKKNKVAPSSTFAQDLEGLLDWGGIGDKKSASSFAEELEGILRTESSKKRVSQPPPPARKNPPLVSAMKKPSVPVFSAPAPAASSAVVDSSASSKTSVVSKPSTAPSSSLLPGLSSSATNSSGSRRTKKQRAVSIKLDGSSAACSADVVAME